VLVLSISLFMRHSGNPAGTPKLENLLEGATLCLAEAAFSTAPSSYRSSFALGDSYPISGVTPCRKRAGQLPEMGSLSPSH
jgi:hypothetical protein